MRSGLRMNLMGALGVALLLSAATAPTLPPDVADAAMRGDVAAVRALLQQGADVNMAQGDGMTALHWAAERADAELAGMLLYAGASVRATTRIGDYTPLHLAAKSGSTPIIQMVVEAGADVNAKTSNSGAAPIHFAAASGDAEAVGALLSAGADANAREGLWHQTPLMFAASLNRPDAIRALLAAGADPNLQSRVPTPLESAAERAGSLKTREMIDAFSADGRTPTPTQVQGAIDAGRAVTRSVIESGVMPVIQDNGRGGRGGGGGGGDDEEPGATAGPGGMTALLHAARQGHVDAVEALIEGGADVNVVRATDETSPLLIATINSQWDVAMRLIAAGADPNLDSAVDGATPLWTTVNSQWQPRTRFPQPQEGWYQQASYLDVLEALLVAGADPDEVVEDQPFYITYSGCGNGNCGLTQLGGTTPFLRAAHSADVEAMRVLAAYGTDVQLSRVERPQQQGGGGGRGGVGRGGRGGDTPPA